MGRRIKDWVKGTKEYKVLAVIEWEHSQPSRKVFTNFDTLGNVMDWYYSFEGDEDGSLRLEHTE